MGSGASVCFGGSKISYFFFFLESFTGMPVRDAEEELVKLRFTLVGISGGEQESGGG